MSHPPEISQEAARQMLAALRQIAVYPDHRHSCPGDAFLAISAIARRAVAAVETAQ